PAHRLEPEALERELEQRQRRGAARGRSARRPRARRSPEELVIEDEVQQAVLMFLVAVLQRSLKCVAILFGRARDDGADVLLVGRTKRTGSPDYLGQLRQGNGLALVVAP